jgi:hypothetical protein
MRKHKKYNDIKDSNFDRLKSCRRIDYIIQRFFSDLDPLMFDGVWGIGKTSLANLIISNLEKQKLLKCKIIPVWDIMNSNAKERFIVNMIWPGVQYAFISFSFIALVLITLINFSIAVTGSSIVGSVITLIIISVTFSTALLINNESTVNLAYEIAFKHLIRIEYRTPYAIFIDDIDRLSNEEQLTLYPILNNLALSKSIKLVALCDRNKLANSELEGIDKLFPIKIPLDALFSSDDIWKTMIEEVESQLKEQNIEYFFSDSDVFDTESLRSIFTNRKMTQRHALILTDAVFRYYTSSRINTVNFGQMLIMIFLHEFFPRVYEFIVVTKEDLTSTVGRTNVETGKLKNTLVDICGSSEIADIVIDHLFRIGLSISTSTNYRFPMISERIFFDRYLVVSLNQYESFIDVEKLIAEGIFLNMNTNLSDDTISAIARMIRSTDILDNRDLLENCIERTALWYLYHYDELKDKGGFMFRSPHESLLNELIKKHKEKYFDTSVVFNKIVKSLGNSHIKACSILPMFESKDASIRAKYFDLIVNELNPNTEIDNFSFIHFVHIYNAVETTSDDNAVDSAISRIFELDDDGLMTFIVNRLTSRYFSSNKVDPVKYLDFRQFMKPKDFVNQLSDRINSFRPDHARIIKELEEEKFI